MGWADEVSDDDEVALPMPPKPQGLPEATTQKSQPDSPWKSPDNQAAKGVGGPSREGSGAQALRGDRGGGHLGEQSRQRSDSYGRSQDARMQRGSNSFDRRGEGGGGGGGNSYDRHGGGSGSQMHSLRPRGSSGMGGGLGGGASEKWKNWQMEQQANAEKAEAAKNQWNRGGGGGGGWDRGGRRDDPRDRFQDSGRDGGGGSWRGQMKAPTSAQGSRMTPHQSVPSQPVPVHPPSRANTGGMARSGTAPLSHQMPAAPQQSQQPIAIMKKKDNKAVGIILSKRDDKMYGFLQVVTEPQSADVFFHYDEAKSPDCDPSKLKIGDEVEFQIIRGHGSKMSARSMKPVEKPGQHYDKVIEGKSGLVGIVIKETFHPPKRQGGGNRFGNRGQSNHPEGMSAKQVAFLEGRTSNKYWEGRIQIMEQAEIDALTEIVPGKIETCVADGVKFLYFAHRGLAGGGSLRRGDVVKLDAAQELATGRIHATNITLAKPGSERVNELLKKQLETLEPPRELGRVLNFESEGKHGVGIIECESRAENVQFMLSDLPAELRPRGRGSSKSDDSSSQGNGRSRGVGKKSGGGSGMPQDWRTEEATKQLEQETDARRLAPGSGVEFVVLEHPARAGTLVAYNVTRASPTAFEAPVATGIKARVLSVQRAGRHNSGANKDSGEARIAGKIELSEALPKEVDVPDDQQSQLNSSGFLELTYTLNDLVQFGPRPGPNDVVQLDVHRVNKNGHLEARALQLVRPAEEKDRLAANPLDAWAGKCVRETGVVSIVRDSYGFIDCFDRPGRVFFPLKEVVAARKLVAQDGFKNRKPVMNDSLLRVGDLVSFYVDLDTKQQHSYSGGGSGGSGGSDDRRTIALRVLKIAEVSNEIVLQDTCEGVVDKAPRAMRSHGSDRGGRGGFSSGRGGGRGGSQEDRMDPGMIKLSPIESCIVAPALWDLLSKFATGKLEKKQSDGSMKQVTNLELLPWSPFPAKRSSGRGARGGGGGGQAGGMPGSDKGKGGGEKDTTKDKNVVVFQFQCPRNTNLVAKDYCQWLGLRAEAQSNSDGQSVLAVRKKGPPSRNRGRKREEKKDEQGKKEQQDKKGNDEDESVAQTAASVAEPMTSVGSAPAKPAEEPTRPPNMIAYFMPGAILERRRVTSGDKVKFRLVFDRRSSRHIAQRIKVADKPIGPVTRREGTETGIISAVTDSFGFVQSSARTERLFFRVPGGLDPSFRNPPRPGDEVEYKLQIQEKKLAGHGDKAINIRLLPKGTVVSDVPVKSPENDELPVFRGSISREPKSEREIKNPPFKRGDHPSAIALALKQLQSHFLGTIIPHNPVTGKPDQEAEREADKPVTAAAGALGLAGAATASSVSWRRENELVKQVEAFADGKEKFWCLETTVPVDEVAVIEARARRRKLFTGRVNDGLVIARSRGDFQKFKQGKMDKDGNTIEQPKTEGKKSEEAAPKESTSADAASHAGGEADETDESDEDADTVLIGAVKPKSKPKPRKEAAVPKAHSFSVADLVQPTAGEDAAASESKDPAKSKRSTWIPMVGDLVEYNLCRNVATERFRATNIRLIKPSDTKVFRGIVENSSIGVAGFVRRLFEKGSDEVEDLLKPGGGGRDGSVRFHPSHVVDGVVLMVGDEVEYRLEADKRTKEVKAVKLRLVKRAPVVERSSKQSSGPPQLNREAMKRLGGAASAVAMQQFHTAKGPDGTQGFPPGRGRSIPIRTKLRVAAKEWTPSSSA